MCRHYINIKFLHGFSILRQIYVFNWTQSIVGKIINKINHIKHLYFIKLQYKCNVQNRVFCIELDDYRTY